MMRTWLLKCLFRVVAWLPQSLTSALGAAMGDLLFFVPNRRRKTAQTNIALCLPELSDAARQRLLRRNLRHLGRTITELCVLWMCDREKMSRMVRRTTGADVISDALKRGKGVILATPHLGAWELVGIYCSIRYPITCMFRALPAARGGRLMRRARERFGAQMAPADSRGIRTLYKALERDEIIFIMPDQVPARRNTSVFAPFFGIPASTMVLLSRLAAKTGAQVVFGYAERLAHGRGYHLHFLPAPAAIRDADVERSCAVVNQMVEQCVRALPDQFLWSYKRFRVAPPGAKPPY